MDYYEVCQIGRESVKSVNASILAALIRQLVNKYEQHKRKCQNYKYYIKCKEKFEFVQKKTGVGGVGGDDEGFESDANEEDSMHSLRTNCVDASNEDAQSTSSSCYLVEDHVFRSSKIDRDPFAFTKETDAPNSIVGSTDSANSSGSSDTDECVDVHSLAPSPIDASCGKKRIDRSNNYKRTEEYPIADVIFCHTEPKYPTVIAWVIKKTHRADYDISSRLGKTGVENIPNNENCLEVIVTKCKSIDALRELCSGYQEYSKRIKLDQYKSINRKRDPDPKKSVSLASLLDGKESKVSLSDMKINNSGLLKASELSILNPKIITSFQSGTAADIKNSISLNSLIKSESVQKSKTGADSQETTAPAEEAIRKSHSLLNLSKTRDSLAKNANVLKDITCSGLNDHFNLVQRTDPNGMTHLEVSKGTDAKSISPAERYANKSKIRKEIEGVILTETDSYAKKEHVRQRQSPALVEGGAIWHGGALSAEDAPPIRPERRKFLKKKGLAPSPPICSRFEPTVHRVPSGEKTGFYLNSTEPHAQKIVKGQYIRVQSWGNQNRVPSENGFGNWKPTERTSRKTEDKYVERKRSKSATRTAKRPTPMAYRYIDITDDSYYPGSSSASSTSSRLHGLSQKIRDVGGGSANISTSVSRRRRNSFDDVIHFENRIKGNLKSVIKKNTKINDKCCEPKKVTFSAFATVQVVD